MHTYIHTYTITDEVVCDTAKADLPSAAACPRGPRSGGHHARSCLGFWILGFGLTSQIRDLEFRASEPKALKFWVLDFRV